MFQSFLELFSQAIVSCEIRRYNCLNEINQSLTYMYHLFNHDHTKGSYHTDQNVQDRPRPCNKKYYSVSYALLMR